MIEPWLAWLLRVALLLCGLVSFTFVAVSLAVMVYLEVRNWMAHAKRSGVNR